MHKLILLCCAMVCEAAPQSIQDVDWKNFSYPFLETKGVPGEVRWMSPGTIASVSLSDGSYVERDKCGADIQACPVLLFDGVKYGALTGIESTVALVGLTYHSGGTANWQYLYVLTLQARQPRLLAWLRTGSRAYKGLREASIANGDLILAVNDPDKQQGDCCSAGTIITRFRWRRGSFSAIGSPVHKIDPPSFDCARATTPVELLICKDTDLSFLDSQMAASYQSALQEASAERKEVIRRQQAEWFADYSRACNAPLSEMDRWECIDRYLNDRLATIWK